MTTRRRIICSILSAFSLSACALFGPDVPQRAVHVKVLVDVPFRSRNTHWHDEARGLIEAASDFYEREFDLRLLTHSVSSWPEQERIASTVTLLTRLQKEFPLHAKSTDYDLIVAFTGENVSSYLAAGRARVDRIGNCAQGLGGYIVAFSLALFAFSTMLGWSFYGERCWNYLVGPRSIMPFRILWTGAAFLGAVTHLDLAWTIADTLNALMAVPNLVALLALADKGARRALLDDPHLLNGLNLHAGQVTHPAVAEALGLPFVEPRRALG